MSEEGLDLSSPNPRGPHNIPSLCIKMMHAAFFIKLLQCLRVFITVQGSTKVATKISQRKNKYMKIMISQEDKILLSRMISWCSNGWR
jgi:hypothetical protein